MRKLFSFSRTGVFPYFSYLYLLDGVVVVVLAVYIVYSKQSGTHKNIFSITHCITFALIYIFEHKIQPEIISPDNPI